MQIFTAVCPDRIADQSIADVAILAFDKDVPPPPGSGFRLVDDLLEANRTAPELEDYRQQA